MRHLSSVSEDLLKSPLVPLYKRLSVGASNGHPVLVSGLLLKRLPLESVGVSRLLDVSF